jgi:hypothetical protein
VRAVVDMMGSARRRAVMGAAGDGCMLGRAGECRVVGRGWVVTGAVLGRECHEADGLHMGKF